MNFGFNIFDGAEVAGVGRRGELGDERRSFLQDELELDRAEPRVSFDFESTMGGTKTFGRNGVEKSADDVSGLFGDFGFFGEVNFGGLDVGEGFALGFTGEGGFTEQHFVDEDTEGPPVDGAGVAFARDDFRSQIFFGADERVGDEGGFEGAGLGLDTARLAEIKVSEHDVTGAVQQDVFGFEIAIDEAEKVEVFEGQQHFGGVELGHGLRQALFGLLLQCSEELAAGAVLHDEVDVLFGLEAVEQAHDEGMLGRRQNLSLCEHSLDFLALSHLRFG